ncbi:MAG: Phosphate transport system permease protein PstA [Verrucomicrobia bacterium ADurb.Bin345]|nr:MAG: Phosphate transport system permease protein PstA [Verrucomicrobia bacterium ADurb.Bin345]
MSSRSTRRILDRAFTGLGGFSTLLLAAALLVILVPILIKGFGAFVFRETVEHRRMLLDLYETGDRAAVETEVAAAAKAREPVYAMLGAFKKEVEALPAPERRKLKSDCKDLEKALNSLLGPAPGTTQPILLRQRYGQNRWDRAQVAIGKVLYEEAYDYSDSSQMGKKILVPRVERFRGTSLEPLFDYVRDQSKAMLLPRWIFYGGFLTHTSRDAHFFGGIRAEVLGTFYLTLGAMLFAVPMGVIAAIYLVEYARDNWLNSLIRSCVSTLAGVPSIVFGLFGLAFFINTIHVSGSKSVLAGSLTLGLLILPTLIRASEEALRAVPHTYKQAALSLGASPWKSITTVILPAALPGILTGIVISMGRAAGETAPIIFTAAVSVGQPLTLLKTLTQPTPALSWNIYNLCTEHEAVDEIRHVQYGMVFTLVLLVLLLNLSAIVIRARLSRKLRV